MYVTVVRHMYMYMYAAFAWSRWIRIGERDRNYARGVNRYIHRVQPRPLGRGMYAVDNCLSIVVSIWKAASFAMPPPGAVSRPFSASAIYLSTYLSSLHMYISI